MRCSDKITYIKVNNKSERCVIHLSSDVLTKLERAVLEKGLKFCPTPREPDMNKILDDLGRYFQKNETQNIFPQPT